MLAVVDPGVGTARKPLVISSAGRLFVGPDNGLLSPALPPALRPHPGQPARPVTVLPGTDIAAHELTAPQFRRPRVSDTFHGRDIFAPAAAFLAAGLDFRRLAPPVASVQALAAFGGVPSGHGHLVGYIIRVDRYGNLVTSIRAAQLFPSYRIEVAGRLVDTRVRTFADAALGTLFCHCDSSGFVAIAMNQGSAAAELAVTRGAPVSVFAT